MPSLKCSMSDGKMKHFLAGAIIRSGKGEYFLYRLKDGTLPWTCILDHIREDESAEICLARVVKDFSGMIVNRFHFARSLLITGVNCDENADVHDCDIFVCECIGNFHVSHDEFIGRWFSQAELQELADTGILPEIWLKAFLNRGIIKPLTKRHMVEGGKKDNSVDPAKMETCCLAGAECSYLCLDLRGWACEKDTPLGEAIRVSAKTVLDNCLNHKIAK